MNVKREYLWMVILAIITCISTPAQVSIWRQINSCWEKFRRRIASKRCKLWIVVPVVILTENGLWRHCYKSYMCSKFDSQLIINVSIDRKQQKSCVYGQQLPNLQTVRVSVSGDVWHSRLRQLWSNYANKTWNVLDLFQSSDIICCEGKQRSLPFPQISNKSVKSLTYSEYRHMSHHGEHFKL